MSHEKKGNLPHQVWQEASGPMQSGSLVSLSD
jgi:hypothetical protein